MSSEALSGRATARSPLTLVRDYLTQVWAVADAEVTKLRHDPMDLLSRAVQPILWLLLFGQVMAHVRDLSAGSGGRDCLDRNRRRISGIAAGCVSPWLARHAGRA